KNIEETKKNIQNLNLRADEIRKKIGELRQKRNVLQSGISEISDKSAKAEEQSRFLGEEADKITDEINRLRIRQSELKFIAESARKTISDAESRLRELTEGSSDVENTIAEYFRRKAENTGQLEQNNKNFRELKNKLKEVEQLYISARNSFEQTKEEFERSLYELKNVQQRRKILVELENSMEGFAGSVKQILKASRQGRLTGIYGTVAQNISVEPKFALAVETSLGGAVQNIIVENEECAKCGIRFLKEQKGGRATFLPVTSVRGHELHENGLENCSGFISIASDIAGYDPKFRGIIVSLLGRTVIAEDIDSATLIAKKYGYKFRIVTLDGQAINAGGAFTGG
ncbi:MAG: chromosome segregation protein SMC, partial [Ruminococcus sp.]|nr:chromosome segregation protein SMC [Ruminococcus sp.]